MGENKEQKQVKFMVTVTITQLVKMCRARRGGGERCNCRGGKVSDEQVDK